MSNPSAEILEAIPQRHPFLFVDEVVSSTKDSIWARYHMTGEEDFFKGHFPGNPIVPGVILQEAVFQSGGVLIHKCVGGGKLGVIGRVASAKFKNFARPGDLLDIEVQLKKNLDPAFYMSGKILSGEKLIMFIDFTVALLPPS